MKLEVGKTVFKSVRLASGESLRVATRHVKDYDGDGTYFIRLGQSLSALESARRRALLVLGRLRFRWRCCWGALAGCCWPIKLSARWIKLQKPQNKLPQAIWPNGFRYLPRRLPRWMNLGRLAATFNHMISRLQAAFERQKQFTSDASHDSSAGSDARRYGNRVAA